MANNARTLAYLTQHISHVGWDVLPLQNAWLETNIAADFARLYLAVVPCIY